MPLTETRLRALKIKDKPYKVADQRGLYVEVTPAGSKLWRFRYRIGKIEKKLSIVSYPEVSLKEARDATYEARQAVASGGDPALEKRKRKIREEFLTAQTFETVAREYIEQFTEILADKVDFLSRGNGSGDDNDNTDAPEID